MKRSSLNWNSCECKYKQIYVKLFTEQNSIRQTDQKLIAVFFIFNVKKKHHFLHLSNELYLAYLVDLNVLYESGGYI